VIGPHKHAPGPFDLRLRLVKYFRLRDGIGPRTPAPGLCGYPSGLVGLCANAHKQCSSEGFSFFIHQMVRTPVPAVRTTQSDSFSLDMRLVASNFLI
jgi:hypothetical protein